VSYQELHARYYDLLYADKPYEQEADAVLAAVARQRVGRPGTLLDVACGTGRHAAVFVERGWDVVGVDINPHLLARARVNVPAATFHQQDMLELDVGREFDVATCLFDALGYVLSDSNVATALRRIAACLVPAGVFVCEVLHAPALLAGASPVGVRRAPLPDGGRLLRIAETNVDHSTRTMRVHYELLELSPNGWRSDDEQQANRSFTVDEITRLWELSGLEVVELSDARTGGGVTDSTWHVLAVARPR
jgi:SAM-dependent methyltransferase